MLHEVELIKDSNYRIIGRILMDERTGEVEVRDFYNRILGRYDPTTDTTRGFSGKIIAHGNAARMLIRPYEEMMDPNWKPL